MSRWPVAFVALASAATLWWSTPHGLGLEGDSADYVLMARQIADGRVPTFETADGRRLAMTQFPPGYPVVLVIGEWLGDALVFARVLHAVLLAATVWIVGALCLRHARSTPVALAASACVGLSPQTQIVFASLMSEALFVPLILDATLLTRLAVARSARPASERALRATAKRPIPPRVACVAVCATLLALATLTRHAGAFVAASLATAWIVGATAKSRPFSGSILPALLTLTLALLPALLWSLWLDHLGAEPARVLRFHAADSETIRRTLAAVGGWAWPTRPGFESAWTQLAGLCVALLLAWAAWRGLRKPRRWATTPGLCAAVLLGYALGLWTSRLLLDAAMPMGVRLWLPAFSFAAVLAAGAATRLARRGRLARFAVAVAAVALLVGNVAASLRQATDLRRDGLGYASPTWTNSPTLAYVRGLPPGTPVVTNAADLVTLLGGREATPLPTTRFRTADRPNRRWRDQLRRQAKRLRDSGGVVVYFDAVDRGDFLVGEEHLRDVLQIEPAATLPDGRAYRVVGVR